MWILEEGGGGEGGGGEVGVGEPAMDSVLVLGGC